LRFSEAVGGGGNLSAPGDAGQIPFFVHTRAVALPKKV